MKKKATEKVKITIFDIVDRIKKNFTRYVNCAREFPKMSVFMDEGIEKVDRRTMFISFADEPYKKENLEISRFGSWVTIEEFQDTLYITVQTVNPDECPTISVHTYKASKTFNLAQLVSIIYDAIVITDMEDSEVDRDDGEMGGTEAYDYDLHNNEGMFKGLDKCEFTLAD